MEYVKRILVLKQVSEGYSITGKSVGGIARVETESGVISLYLSLINCASVSSGEYYFYMLDGNKKFFTAELGKKPVALNKIIENEMDVLSGLCVGLCYIKDNLPSVVAFSSTPDCKIGLSEFKKFITEKCFLSYKAQTKIKEELNGDYNDEVIATENYYALDEEFDRKMEFIKKFDDFNNEQFKNFGGEQEGDKKSENVFGCRKNEENIREEKYNEQRPYYSEVKEELQNIFEKFERYEKLSNLIPESEWVKIDYSLNKYYVVGKIYKENELSYICYGVPAEYSNTPPKELEGFCTFVPLSVFNLKGSGFWMMFQNAITGECVKPK